MNALLIVRLLLAHILGDFLLQTKGMCEGKKALTTWKGWKYQLAHAFIYTAAVYVLVAQWWCWELPLLIGGTHFAVDVAKALIEKRMCAADSEGDKAREDDTNFVNRQKLLLFVLDQIFHLSVLALAYFWLLDGKGMPLDFNLLEVGIYALTYLLVLTPTAVFIQNFFSALGGSKDKKSLPLGGMYIGYLERILIVSFILSGWMEGIGYLLAAKSVFRFGELRNNKDLMHTEYILLGTFLSFTVAVVVGLLAHRALEGLVP